MRCVLQAPRQRHAPPRAYLTAKKAQVKKFWHVRERGGQAACGSAREKKALAQLSKADAEIEVLQVPPFALLQRPEQRVPARILAILTCHLCPKGMQGEGPAICVADLVPCVHDSACAK